MLGFIHRFVPPDRGENRSILLLHGTGGNEDDLLPVGKALLPGAALVSPRGKISENGMPRFFRRFSEGVFDEEDIRLRARELAEFVRGAAEEYGLDHSRIIGAGYSNGANIAAAMLLLFPRLLSAAVLFHAMVPLVPDPLPDLSGLPVFLSGGKRDTLIPPSETGRLSRLLESLGASVRLSWQPGGHGLSEAEVMEAREWLGGLQAGSGG